MQEKKRSTTTTSTTTACYWERLHVAAWVEVHFDASRRGKKTLNSSRDRNEGTYRRSGEGGGGPRYVTPDLSYYWEGGR